MRHIVRFSVLALMGLCLFCLTDSRADDTAAVPQLSQSEAAPDQPSTTDAFESDAVEKEPAEPRFVLLLTRRATASAPPIARRAAPIPNRFHEDEFYIEAAPEPAFSRQKLIPKRSHNRAASRPSAPETLQVLCTDVKLSGATAGKSVDYTIECSGPLILENGETTIRCSKLSYAEGTLTLDDVTIHQNDSTAGLLEELRTKQLTIKFPVESVTLQDADKPQAPELQEDSDLDPNF